LEDGKATISVINEKAIDKLIDVLRNKGLIVRFDAAQALGEVKDKAAVDSLIKMLQEEANPIQIRL
jgi:HEAT repeat protein